MLGIQRRPERGCIMLIYIDDKLIVGKREAVDEAIQVLQQSFEMKSQKNIRRFLGSSSNQEQNGEKAWLGQPTIIKSLEKMFDEDIKTLQSTLTPGSPGFVEQKVVDDENKTTDKEKSFIGQAWELYCSSQDTLNQICSMRTI